MLLPINITLKHFWVIFLYFIYSDELFTDKIVLYITYLRHFFYYIYIELLSIFYTKIIITHVIRLLFKEKSRKHFSTAM